MLTAIRIFINILLTAVAISTIGAGVACAAVARVRRIQSAAHLVDDQQTRGEIGFDVIGLVVRISDNISIVIVYEIETMSQLQLERFVRLVILLDVVEYGADGLEHHPATFAVLVFGFSDVLFAKDRERDADGLFAFVDPGFVREINHGDTSTIFAASHLRSLLCNDLDREGCYFVSVAGAFLAVQYLRRALPNFLSSASTIAMNASAIIAGLASTL